MVSKRAKKKPSKSKRTLRMKPKRKSSKSKAHPRQHKGFDGDIPFFVDEIKKVNVKHLEPKTAPKIKRELKVKELKELQQVRGVQKIPGISLNGHTESISKRIPAEPRPRSAQTPYPTIVIAGLGFAGLTVAKQLKDQLKGKGRIIGIDQSDRFVFIPALMAMASGFFKYEEISVPFTQFTKQVGMDFVHDSITSFDTKNRVVNTKTKKIPYDYLIVTLGAASNPLPSGFDDKTLALRHVWDANDIWKKVTQSADHQAEQAGRRNFDVKIAIVGGGATGIQLASWMKDGLQHYINRRFGRRGKAIISLYHGGPELVPGCPKRSRKQALELLINQGVTVHLNAKAKGSKDNTLMLDDGSSSKFGAVIFCGGWRQSPILPTLNLPLDERSGVRCNLFLQSVADPYVFAAGDALWLDPEEINIPGWKRAQNARKVAKTLAQNIISHSSGEPMDPFALKDTPIVLDLRPKSILILEGKSYSGRFWWYFAQGIRILNLFVVRHPKIPVPY